ncbi:forkhead box protein P1-like isoform X2 [Argiope bruennichi]|uniref:forkhead box protein P1-like isoform X2 n=1 Tax=Argiope bruennichi TaxID=94029 RepID=UPI002493DFBA|nr:forkhead box protein P1-like isoform X2 [Argiope bruennichi]
MMDHEEDGDVAINLSKNQAPRSADTPNGNAEPENGEPQGSKALVIKRSRSANHTDKSGGNESNIPPLLMMNSQLLAQHQLQQLLQQPSPTQLQQLLQQQQSIFLQQQQQQHQQHQQLKQLESVIPHIQEQINLNIMQQSQILHQLNGLNNGLPGLGSSDKKANRQQLQLQLQQLALQQHQLMQQLQLSNRQYMINLQPFMLPQGLNANDMWKEGSGDEGGASLNGMMHGGSSGGRPLMNGAAAQHESYSVSPVSTASSSSSQRSLPPTPKEEQRGCSSPPTHALYGHGVCKWPGCEAVCDDYQAFKKHLNLEHQLDDRSTAQARVQMQVVSQLELQLSKEKERLQAMMQHLHMKPYTNNGTANNSNGSNHNHRNSPSKTENNIMSNMKSGPPTSPQMALVPAVSSSPPALSAVMTTMSNAGPLMAAVPQRLGPPPPLHPPNPNTMGPARRRLSDKSCPPLSVLDVPSLPDSPIRRRVVERANLDITEEIQRNREFYRNADVRPPFTYASLIRQAIIEAPEKQLTLNEIYNWFQNTFCYFRRNAATWKGKFRNSSFKNAVRHNLSLHKCFMRVENVKGAVWTVDELEFYKRRPQRLQERMSGLQMPAQGLVPQGVPLMHGQGRMGSPPLRQSPGLYGDSLNASLQAALAESNLSFLNSSVGGSGAGPNTPTSTPTPAATPDCVTSQSCGTSALSEAERYVVEMITHGMNNSSMNGSNIHIKQEPLSDETGHMCPPEIQHPREEEDRHSEANSDPQGMHDEQEEDMEEAEDLSLSSSINSEPQATTCP